MKVKIKVKNCSEDTMSITKEPEAVEVFIANSDEIEIETNEVEDNISINIGKNEDGTIYVQIWDSLNTRYVINKGGENIFKNYL
ncbi:hypothetical protein FAZ19_22415 [Sphingobacterium alkalisoli]|uniref:Uncharacterized protein n=1 Tax=Sphingobacterium alkalisoli TaxID=1874115 RepID=A0A4U0GPK6_9SPHI|nr:hypothetical protein [Sphingobacterium alkalisoli]TJY60697.1 hypothetical protein FAZ19_22415 [Sphingobacterium alkalisoli]GGH31396.1 hypothetical protein GCM10011418_44150 [Sphingobacterium alkalisoli]